MEYKSIPAEIKAVSGNRIEGFISSTGGPPDLMDDIIEPGAFTKTVKEKLPKNEIKVLQEHMHAIGLAEKVEEQNDGMVFGVGKISNTPTGRDTLVLAKDKVFNRFSIGFSIVKASNRFDNPDGIRFIQELILHEFSPVLFPANPRAVISGIKSMIRERVGSLDQLDALDHLTPDDLMNLDGQLKALGREKDLAVILKFAQALRDIVTQPLTTRDTTLIEPGTEPGNTVKVNDLRELHSNILTFREDLRNHAKRSDRQRA